MKTHDLKNARTTPNPPDTNYAHNDAISNEDARNDAISNDAQSQLLSPLDGNDAARHDGALVKEYCEWSVGLQPRPTNRPERLENFLNIASKTNIQHKRYRRDLMVLLEYAAVIARDDLVLDLGKQCSVVRFCRLLSIVH